MNVMMLELNSGFHELIILKQLFMGLEIALNLIPLIRVFMFYLTILMVNYRGTNVLFEC